MTHQNIYIYIYIYVYIYIYIHVDTWLMMTYAISILFLHLAKIFPVKILKQLQFV